jgi:hypothetical protein
MKNKILFWIPRILCILAIGFVMMFSLDVFDPKYTLSEQLLGFLMHNIPAWILIGLLVISWRWEFVGGIIFIIISIAMILLFTKFLTMNYYSMIVSGPFMIVGALFIWHSKIVKNAKTEEK